MANFLDLVALSTLMGLSIFLSMPVVLRKEMASKTIAFLNAAAIGILVFLLADIWGDVWPNLYPTVDGQTSFVANATEHGIPLALVFLLGVVGAFALLYFAEGTFGRRDGLSPSSTALIIALAIGFQNLTEGLVFGSSWGGPVFLPGLLAVIFIGFFLQNVTEGFPITSPFLGSGNPRIGTMSLFFLVGGLPTILGGVLGYFYNDVLLDVAFDALAIGSILYAVLPMLKVAFRPRETPEASRRIQQIVYAGIIAGFAVGFLTNAI
jgi:zinc transporter, ZIP family